MCSAQCLFKLVFRSEGNQHWHLFCSLETHQQHCTVFQPFLFCLWICVNLKESTPWKKLNGVCYLFGFLSAENRVEEEIEFYCIQLSTKTLFMKKTNLTNSLSHTPSFVLALLVTGEMSFQPFTRQPSAARISERLCLVGPNVQLPHYLTNVNVNVRDFHLKPAKWRSVLPQRTMVLVFWNQGVSGNWTCDPQTMARQERDPSGIIERLNWTRACLIDQPNPTVKLLKSSNFTKTHGMLKKSVEQDESKEASVSFLCPDFIPHF